MEKVVAPSLWLPEKKDNQAEADIVKAGNNCGNSVQASQQWTSLQRKALQTSVFALSSALTTMLPWI